MRNLEELKAREDKGVAAIEPLSETSKWAAFITLTREFGLRITQVDMGHEMIKAFNRETESR